MNKFIILGVVIVLFLVALVVVINLPSNPTQINQTYPINITETCPSQCSKNVDCSYCQTTYGGTPICLNNKCVEIVSVTTTIPSQQTTTTIQGQMCTGFCYDSQSGQCYSQTSPLACAQGYQCVNQCPNQPTTTIPHVTTTIPHTCTVGGVCYVGGTAGQYNSACQCCYQQAYQSTCENWCFTVDTAKCNADYNSCVSGCTQNLCNNICHNEQVNCDADYPCNCNWYDVPCWATWNCVQNVACKAGNWLKNVCTQVCNPFQDPVCKAGCDANKAVCLVTQIKIRCDQPCTKYRNVCS